MENPTSILHGIDDLKLEDTPIPEPKNGEVQLRMSSVGICGSDIHYWKHGCIGDFVLKKPMIMGHESSGVVSKLGEGVSSLQVGDRVAIEPGVPCRTCDFCKRGRYNLCLEMAFCATPPIDGSLRHFYCHPADFCYKIPDHVSMDEAALLEPLSVGVHACRRAGVCVGEDVLICGAGPIGLVCLLTAKAMGAQRVCVTDIDDNRLSVAKKLGACCTLNVRSLSVEQSVSKLHELFGDQPNISIECSGALPSIQTCIKATKSGGVVTLVGLGAAEATIPIVNASVREIDIRGVFRYTNCYPVALSMVTSGQVDVKPLITHRFKLTEMLKAFELASKASEGAIKVVIDCS